MKNFDKNFCKKFQDEYYSSNYDVAFNHNYRDAMYEHNEYENMNVDQSVTISWAVNAYVKEKKSVISKIKDKFSSSENQPELTMILNNCW